VYHYISVSGKTKEGKEVEIGKAPFLMTHSTLYREDNTFDHESRPDMRIAKFMIAKVPDGPFGDPNKIFTSLAFTGAEALHQEQ
jgi:hypothetical protein